MRSEITKFKKKYLDKIDELLEDVCEEDLDFWVRCRVSTAIDKAYKIGKKENENRRRI